MEPAFNDIEEDGRISIDGNPGEQQADSDQQDTRNPTPARKPPFCIGGVDDESGAVLIDRSDGIKAWFLGMDFHGNDRIAASEPTGPPVCSRS